jgi:protein-disulfide isomerase
MADHDDKHDVLDVPATERDHGVGPMDAPVTLVEYGDYECPDCFNAEPVVSGLRERFGKRLRVVFRHFPRNSIHPHSGAAAVAAEAAAVQGRFWDMHAALFRHQKELADLDLTHLALRIGLEPYKFQQASESAAVQKHVQSDYDGAVRNGVNGTPTFFINGRRYRGPAEVEAMAKAIEGATGAA